ncbi:unnamed protein product [Thelazia callipaeda]|uniref:Division abnormally delayed protein n=1 Tax=Thelazia callipaeda TaxID=103827 RepID=A0A0N5CKB8_THECL|nr:unnamed protein product [Thelazia callipaeda]
MENIFHFWSKLPIYHTLLILVTCGVILLSALPTQANEKTVITLKDLTDIIVEKSCSCAENAEILKKNDEHLRLLFKISSVRVVSTLQSLVNHVNAEVTYLIDLTRWKLYEEIKKVFSRLLSQPSVTESIDELIDNIRNQLFINTEISPQRLEKEVERIVQKFFVQLIPPTFLCITTGPCKSVSQSYANCLQNNAPSWKIFFGAEPSRISAFLRQTILKYRLIESTIDKLHRSATEIESINDICLTRYTLVTSCASSCLPKQSSNEENKAIGYCSDDCKNVVRACLHEGANDWDAFISILRKLSADFDKGFIELEKGIVRSMSYATEVRAPVIAKTVIQKCGRVSYAKVSDNTRKVEFTKPNPIQRKAAQMIRQEASNTRLILI